MSTLSRRAAALLTLALGLVLPVLASVPAPASVPLATASAATAATATSATSISAPAAEKRAARRAEVSIPARTVSAGGEHSCAIRTDGSLWCWGRNNYGQLGLKRSGPYAVPPEQVGTRKDWRAVSAGGASTCGVRANGTLWCWGVNHRRQLGTGATKAADRPQRVGKNRTWSGISVGYTHACGVRTNNTLYCWGDNSAGQLGTGGKKATGKPQRVAGKSWRKVVTGGWHTCALKTDSSLWCWGRNTFGQLGSGTYRDSSRPVRVGSGLWRTVALSWTHTCGITSAGQARCWGRNLQGQLGDGTTTVNARPRVVLNQPQATGIAVNEGSSCLVSASDQVWCWGSNSYGIQGVGSAADSRAAKRARRLSGVTSLSGGWLHTCGLGAGSKPVCWGNNERGQVGVVPAGAGAPRAAARTTTSAARKKDGPLTFGIASMNALGQNHSRPYADADQFAPGRVRAEWTFDAVDTLGASVVGLQEPTAEQLAAIVSAGDGAWAVYPTPDEGDRRVESPIAWRTDQWEAVEKTTIRTQFINRQLARPVVKLRHKATGKEIWVLNVHNAPWEYQAKRNAAVKVEIAKIKQLEATGLPVFFLGDMNEKRTIVCKVLDQTGLVSPAGGRINGQGECVTPKVMRVDWIFGSATATYTGFTYSKHPMARLVTDHWVPVVRATIP